MDKENELLQDIWDNWKPYNASQDGKWRSYLVTQDIEPTGCLHLAQSHDGQVYEIS